MEVLHGLRPGASLGVYLFQPFEFSSQLADALISRGELIEVGVKRQDQSGWRFEDAIGIFVHKLFEKHSCALPVRIRASQRVCEAEPEQCLFAFVRRRRKAQTLLIIADGVVIRACGKGSIRAFEHSRGRWTGIRPRSGR